LLVKRALLSVSNKDNLIEFARGLSQIGIELWGTSGTVSYLQSNKVEIRDIQEITNTPPILDGRVKTLHYQIAAAILFDRENAKHIEEINKRSIKPIDMVVVNLYPFMDIVKAKKDWRNIIENIDIGGVTLIRAAAKNYKDVIVITSPLDYNVILKELRETGNLTEEKRKELAYKAFAHTASYDAYITKTFNTSTTPSVLIESHEKLQELRYGINPHQEAAVYVPQGEEPPWKLLAGDKGISYNNLLDLNTIMQAFTLFDGQHMAIIIKHTNPCGVAVSTTHLKAYRLALQADEESAFGGVVGINGIVDQTLAEELVSTFKDAVIAKGYEEGVVDFMHSRRKKLCIIELKYGASDYLSYRRFYGYLLAQREVSSILNEEDLKVVTKRRPTKEEWEDLRFAWKVTSLVNSNAIVTASSGVTTGIGSGNVNRARAVRYAIEQAANRKGVLASDGFFPFSDSIKIAAKGNITAIIQPGGSIRDSEVIQEADKHGIAMVFTGRRTFKH